MSKVNRMQQGDIKRTVKCNFCGQEHRRASAEMRECRKRHRRGLGPAEQNPLVASAPRDDGRGPSTLRSSDPLGGNPRAHLIARRLREGMAIQKVAKLVGVPRSEVERVQQAIGSIDA